MKTHLSFATSDLSKSVEFYRTLLDAEPQKMLPDYALFITEEPSLELALNAAATVTPTSDAHYGILVDSTEAVERAIARLEGASLVSRIERAETCCYAKQTKVWTTDPMGRRWEIYTVHADTDERDDYDSTCCAGAGNESCCSS